MKEDIIAMAREAGFADGVAEIVGLEGFARFAALVAAAERNKVAQWMMTKGYATGHGDTTEDLLEELEWQVRESEREAIAKYFADHWRETWTDEQIVEAIRARGEDPMPLFDDWGCPPCNQKCNQGRDCPNKR